jgi:hypothetical protein
MELVEIVEGFDDDELDGGVEEVEGDVDDAK